jgi:DNA (cytosine-5)-methyltransferase 1
MKFVSLFAGVGGFDLGLERSGHTCVGQVEIDKHAKAVLEKQFPNVPKHNDVTTAIDWADEIGITGNVDLICGGFPCQDLSVAGKRAGLAGARSGLFFDALRFATHTKAKTILLENVPGLLSSNQGRDFGAVILALGDAGYSNIEWRVLDSQFFGVAQRRRRVFIVANLGTEPFRQILTKCESSAGDFA